MFMPAHAGQWLTLVMMMMVVMVMHHAGGGWGNDGQGKDGGENVGERLHGILQGYVW